MSARTMALDALETAKNGLLWFIDSFPASQSGSDDEAIAEIDQAIAALEADIAQPVAWVGEIAEESSLMLDKPNWPAIAIYTAPPEPAVNAELLEALKRCKFDSMNMSLADMAFCRAAYLKATS